MSPRYLPVVGALLLTGACGSPPEALPAGPPRPYTSAGLSASGIAPPPPPPVYPTTFPTTLPTFPAYPTTTYVVPTRTTVPATSPTPTPSHAPRCTGEPTGAQIVAEAKKNDAVPAGTLTVSAGPYCSGLWSFTTIGKTGAEPLFVVATGKGDTLELVTLGTDVCNPRVKAEAPVGIRVLACGY